MNKHKINYLVSLVATIILSSIFLPIKVSGGLNGKTYYTTTSIFNYFITNDNMCIDCLSYKISWLLLIIEFILIFFLSLILLNLIDKRSKK